MFCQKCGTQLNDDAAFCGKCGCKVSSTTEQSTENNNIVIDTQSVTNQQPTYQQPVYQQPIPQQPVYQQPVPQQPVYQQPVYQQPVPQQPVYQQPVPQQPVYQQPVPQQSVYQQPVPQQSVPQSVQPEPIPVSKQVFDTTPVSPFDINSSVHPTEFVKPTKNISGKFSDFFKKITSNKKLLIISIVSLVVIIALIVIIVVSVVPPSLVGTWGEGSSMMPIIYIFDSDHTGEYRAIFSSNEELSHNFTWETDDDKLYINCDKYPSINGEFTYTLDHDFLILYKIEKDDTENSDNGDERYPHFLGKKLSTDTSLSNTDLLSLSEDYVYEVRIMRIIYTILL